jgi:hypothetical protein
MAGQSFGTMEISTSDVIASTETHIIGKSAVEIEVTKRSSSYRMSECTIIR